MSDNLKLSGGKTFFFTHKPAIGTTVSNTQLYADNQSSTAIPPVFRFIGFDLLETYGVYTQAASPSYKVERLNKYFEWDAVIHIEGIRVSWFLGNSLVMPSIAEIEIYDNQAQKILKYNDMQKSDTISLEIYHVYRDRQYFNTTRSDFLKSVKMQNFGRIIDMEVLTPYLVTDNSPLTLGLWQGLGFRIKNDGYGLVQPGDFVNIGINAKYLITGYPKRSFDTSIRNLNTTISSTNWTPILDSNPDRIKLCISNTGDQRITLAFTQTPESPIYYNVSKKQGIILEPGGSWNDEGLYTIKQKIWAIAHQNSSEISGIESTVVVSSGEWFASL